MKTGHIEITDNKIIFVYHELEKPKKEDFWGYKIEDEWFDKKSYNHAMKEYEASKKVIEVSNVKKVAFLYFFYFGDKVIMHPDYELKNGTPCKAEVNGTAIIIELN